MTYPATHCPFTTAWVDAIYGGEFHRTDGGGDMFYTGPFYNGPHRAERRAAILTYVPHTFVSDRGICRICWLPGADHPEVNA